MEKVLASLMKDDRFKLHRPGSKVSYSAALGLLQFLLQFNIPSVPALASVFTSMMSDSVNN